MPSVPSVPSVGFVALVSFGRAGVVLGLVGALVAVACSVSGRRAGCRAGRRAGHRARWGRRALVGSWVGVTAAAVSLGRSLVEGDWSLVYVADYTSRDTPWPYRLSALWAGMAGSLLVWAWFLAAWGVVAGRWCARRLPALAPGLTAVMAALVALFVALTLGAADPFARLEIPAIDGGGLTPVLRHPAMLYHPPLLYAGAVALAVPFALASAARLGGGGGAGWVEPARRWALGSLGVLTIGMVAGSHWAYVELGWGGYWAWDPVENGILLPWLAAVAFVHAARRHPPRAAANLAALAFALGLLGSFLTRSGATASVHAFAEAPAVGWTLGLATLAALAGWAVVARRPDPAARPPGTAPTARPAPLSVDGALRANQVVLLGAVVAVGVGTLLPLAWRLVTGERLVVGGRYFALVTWPAALAVLAAAGPAMRLRRGGGWRAGSAPAALWPAAPGAAAGAAVGLAVGRAEVFTVAGAVVGGASAGLVVAEAVWAARAPARRAVAGSGAGGWGALLSHLGVIVLLMGVAGTVAGERRTGVLGPGQVVEVGGYQLALEGVAASDPDGPGAAVKAEIALSRDGARLATLRPEALVTERAEPVSVAGLRSTPIADVMVMLRSVGPDGASAVVDVAVHPLAVWIWWGGLLVAGGFALSARGAGTGRDHRAIASPVPAPAVSGRGGGPG